MIHSEHWVAWATLYTQKYGLSVIPMGEDKIPAAKWKEYQTRLPSLEELLEWPKENLAIVTGAVSNLVVVDCESREDAEWFYRNRSMTNTICQSRRGFHLYFRHPGERVQNAQKVKDESGKARYDIRGDGGYVLAPPSKHSEGEYKWALPLVPTAELPKFDPAWRPAATYTGKTEGEIHNAERYIASIRAVSGEGGHANTWRAVNTLREGGLSESEALLVMLKWNKTNAEPEWSEHDLLHKVRDAYS